MSVNIYKKGSNVHLSEHFSTSHFDCHCSRSNCDTTLVCPDLVEALEVLWRLTGGFHIDSGFRCSAHNAEVGGAHDSQHIKGNAADCRSIKGYNGHAMAGYAEQVNVFAHGGIGTYKDFAHCDVRGYAARWDYSKRC